ncbi:uncharacterized protein LOC114969155 [Acropora millepora]|uniref:uncharacterized protein LOC114969155 n=1 Tax=Acropora millepora TaxID=45264 RepID=UPI0010FCD189|nr:uncharacterized protein LOC114969155 [Acropora millepora]
MNYLLMKMTEESPGRCPSDCSGHGSCVRGACVCEVKYSGGSCSDTNMSYFVGFGAVFYLVCAVSFIQLVLCVRSEFHKLKKPSLLKACRLTVQKALYLCMIVACGTRGLYYSIQRYLPDSLGVNLFNAYYPLIISGFSVIICFWAETFHVSGLRLDRPCFLNKSTLGCIIFNVFTYTVFVAFLITTEVTDGKTKVHLSNIFFGFFVALMFLVLTFFLIYGVEIFYKVRGAFITRDTQPSNVDAIQATISRFGLFSQASLQLVTSLLLLGDIIGHKWKDSLPVEGRNALEIIFRVFELGVALWFPCCLWDWKSPSKLWILNPTRLLVHGGNEERRHLMDPSRPYNCYKSITPSETPEDLDAPQRDCWVCYDSERTDAGPMIFPCRCKGDVAAVHHDCLKRWLIESSVDSHEDAQRCKVCGEKYKLTTRRTWIPTGLSVRQWIQTTVILSMMVGTPVGVYLVCLTEIPPTCKILVLGLAVVLEYVCLRLMGLNMLNVYRRARLATMTIVGRPVTRIEELPEENQPTAEAREITAA